MPQPNKHSRKYKMLYNALGFNAAWWTCVLGAKWNMPYLGPSIMLLYLIIHWMFISKNNREILFLFIAAIIGTMVDSAKAASGFIVYSGGYGLEWITPLWITAMWVGFAALLNHSLGWLKNRYLLAALMGAIFAPPAYLTGVKFNVLTLNLDQWLSIAIIALVWGIAVPGLVKLSEMMKAGEYAVSN